MIKKFLIRREMAKNFNEKWRFSAGVAPKPKNTCVLSYHKTQLLSLITYPLTIKINPDNTVYANVSVSPPPHQYTDMWKETLGKLPASLINRIKENIFTITCKNVVSLVVINLCFK